MKVSFSRKGFDSENGSQPNAILPDGTLLVFPIPDEKEGVDSYGELIFQGRSLIDYIKELKPTTKLNGKSLCHLDPDLISDIKKRPEGWIPAFGQSNQSLSELRNNNFGIGDLFLFFGWFKETEVRNGFLKYKRGAPDIHLIYGYLQVGSTLENTNVIPNGLESHPHASKININNSKDAIYLPNKKLSFNTRLPGASMLKYSPKLLLTAANHSRSKWALPSFFESIHIGHCPKQPENQEYFQSPAKGQEMIWNADENKESYDWLREICSLIE